MGWDIAAEFHREEHYTRCAWNSPGASAGAWAGVMRLDVDRDGFNGSLRHLKLFSIASGTRFHIHFLPCTGSGGKYSMRAREKYG